MAIEKLIKSKVREIPDWPKKSVKNAACLWKQKRIVVPATSQFVITAANVRQIAIAAAKKNNSLN